MALRVVVLGAGFAEVLAACRLGKRVMAAGITWVSVSPWYLPARRHRVHSDLLFESLDTA